MRTSNQSSLTLGAFLKPFVTWTDSFALVILVILMLAMHSSAWAKTRKNSPRHKAPSAPNEVYSATEGSDAPDFDETPVAQPEAIEARIAPASEPTYVRPVKTPAVHLSSRQELERRFREIEADIQDLRTRQSSPSSKSMTVASVSTETPTDANIYDPVPTDQTDSIARRLHVVEALIRRHGRAYDYRTHTLRELEGILASLESSPESRTTN